MDGAKIRQTMLEILAKSDAERGGLLYSSTVIKETAIRLGVRGKTDMERAVLAYWHNLVCNGQVAWGSDLMNSDPPFCHLTERGRNTLKNLSRDPLNPEGYMQHLRSTATLDDIAGAYIEEALQTYAASCYRATAVMAGAAAEKLILGVRDALADRMAALKKPIPKKLQGWKIKEVFDALADAILGSHTKPPTPLRESFEAYWPAFVQQIRAARNEAGHPSSIAPVTPESVHATLLIFPELAKLAHQLGAWVRDHYD
jgi:hypothetical protein